MDLDEIVSHIKNKYSYIGSKPIYVGMSGGVDSSVTAVVLKLAGFNVNGFYMLCWNEDTPGCTTDIDRHDAESVALTYDIAFQVIDLRKEYLKKVVQKARSLYKHVVTPNPDITCN